LDVKIKLRIVLVNLIIFATLFGLVTLNKTYLRPNVNDSDMGQMLTGCLPNFLAGFLICLIVINPILTRKVKNGRTLVYSLSFLVFAILTLEEFKPYWGASTYLDYYDILASGLGAFLAVVTYEILERRNRNLQPDN